MRNLVAVSEGGSVSIWEFAKDEPPLEQQLSDNSSSIILFHDNEPYLVAAGEDFQEEFVRKLEMDELILKQQPSDKISSLSFSEDSQFLAAGTVEGEVVLWELSANERFLSKKISSDEISSVSISRDGQFLAAGTVEGEVVLWEPKIGKLWLKQELYGEFLSDALIWQDPRPIEVQLSNDGKYLLAETSDSDEAYIWSVAATDQPFNIQTGKTVQFIDFFDKQFLVADSIWELGMGEKWLEEVPSLTGVTILKLVRIESVHIGVLYFESVYFIVGGKEST